ncbi:type IV secretion system protein [Bartonella senegalensis]|uniref:type IV secretion system protein n=1 Tax=Bartonella senegalensis TaxID=1468418 RepID=UPI0002E23DC8|nr:type IV secretion system protein [Bartonella senegalensis]
MKKIIIAIATATMILGIINPAVAIIVGGVSDLSGVLSKSYLANGSSPKISTPQTPTQQRHIIVQQRPNNKVIELLQKQLDVHQKQLEQQKETYNSITNGKHATTQTQDGSFFLKDPQSIYKKDNSEISASISKVLNEEEISNSINDARKSIEERKQYAAVVDKAVSLHVFEQTENRSQKILELLSKINQTKDLKSITELQTEIKAKLAMIQNEATKLQMVAHLRNAEREFISHQKQKRNMKILNSKNTAMPVIRFIR